MNHRHQIFISSQLKPGTLNDERRSAYKVINKFNFIFVPWDWENDGPTGPKTPMEYCLIEVRRSYALVLIVGNTLTKHTRAEYNLAKKEGKHLFVFFKKGCQRGTTLSFRKRLKQSWLEFQNTSEFKSMLHKSLRDLLFMATEEYKATPSSEVAYMKARS